MLWSRMESSGCIKSTIFGFVLFALLLLWLQVRQPKLEFDDAHCQLPVSSDFDDFLLPARRHGSRSYLIPRERKNHLLSPEALVENTTYVFIHVNKAGGTLIKEEVFKQVALERKWNGAGFGSLVGWRQLLRPCKANSGPIAEGEALSCGHPAPLSACGPVGKRCPLRLLWGSRAMGFCQLAPEHPCVMLVVLRNPVERMISQYNYVCAEAKEGKKKWSPSWRKMGRCPLTLLEFVDSNLTSTTFLIDRLTQAGDAKCGIKFALHNLKHSCLRFLLLEKLMDGVSRLARDWGSAMRPHLEAIVNQHKKKNQSPYHHRTMFQIEDKAIMAELRSRLKLDMEFYNRAKELYEEQWTVPLESCN